MVNEKKVPWIECRVQENAHHHELHNGKRITIRRRLHLHFVFGELARVDTASTEITSQHFDDATLTELASAMNSGRWVDVVDIINRMEKQT